MSNNNYRISVIIGIYNCASTLYDALDSLLTQSYKSFKIILCDDGSTDETYCIAEKYANKYSNIILLKNGKNMGLNYTLNRCLEYADTEYIARMDGDDISLPDRFLKEIEFLDNNPDIAIVSCPMIYFDENGDFKTGKNNTPYPQPKDFIHGTPFCHAPCMVRREAYIAVNGYTENKRLLRVEDYHLWFKMYAIGYRGHNLNEPLYKMRDDRNAYKRRTFSSRLNEAYVRFIGFRMLKQPFYFLIFSLRPIFVGLLPNWLYTYLHKNRN
ncbi:glycosyltransferase [Methanobrevibacter sp.]|uniref:glycosyltransferase n=1 Tax=Methanobrevibacter sp. TaxID=66852 RepID=UPI00388D70C9